MSRQKLADKYIEFNTNSKKAQGYRKSPVAAFEIAAAALLPPKKTDRLSGVRVQIAAVAALLRNDVRSVFLSDTSREAAQRLAMTQCSQVLLRSGEVLLDLNREKCYNTKVVCGCVATG